MGTFDGRTVFVTGGHGALGEAVVAAFRDGGAEVVAPGRKDLELTDEEAVTAAYATLPGLWASVHIAGGFAIAKAVDTRLADFRAQQDQNLTTCFLACREAARTLLRFGGGGRIVNVASRPGLVPAAGMIGYATSKAAVVALTRCLAEEFRQDGILVNAVAPSTIDTPANRAAMPRSDFAKWPKPGEIAAAIVWLASPGNTLTSGEVLPVYGKV